jgi:hypothetical protein
MDRALTRYDGHTSYSEDTTADNASSPRPETPRDHSGDTQKRAGDNGGSGRGYLAVGGPLSSPGMAYWMVACSVYLYIAILGANVRCPFSTNLVLSH